MEGPVDNDPSPKEGDEPTKRAKVDKLQVVPPEPRSTIIKEIASQEERSLRDWLRSLSSDGGFKVVLSRSKPETIKHPVTGADLSIAGHLETYEEPFDEEFLKQEWGGGTYQIKPMLMGKSGSFEYVKGAHRTIRISGLPRFDKVPGVAPIQPVVPSSPSESPTLAKAALDTMVSLLDRQDKAAHVNDDLPPAIKLMFDEMKRSAEAREREVAELRRQLEAGRNKPPETNPILDKILSNAIDGQSGHVEALRLRHEAELRQVKESALQDQRRIEDRHDRQLSEMRQSHELALASLKSSYEREIVALRSSHEVTLAAARSSHEVQMHTLKGDVARLERDNADLRAEVRELREKKDKPLLEQLKDMKTLKEALADDDAEETSTIAKIAGAITPENIAAVGGLIRPTAQQAAPAAVAAPPPMKRAVIKAMDPRDGQTKTFVRDETGKMHLATRKPKMVEGADGKPVEVPVIDPAQLESIIKYLEQAYGNSVEPDIIAQSARSYIPADIMTWLRANDTEQVSGIDLFMSRVARLPGSSPLATQKGKNWLRAVGRALVS